MTGDASAYAVLGVDSAADSDEIEQAYRRLIKQFHPDRGGGDASRAAEINRAYGELRGVRDLKDPLELNLNLPEQQSRRGWLLFALLLALATAALLWWQSSFAPAAEPQRAAAAHLAHARTIVRDDPMDQPLTIAAIQSAALQALHIYRTSDEFSLANASRDCHRRLRTMPAVPQFDRCAAFDNAVVQLEDRDPLRDQGPFGELAVTGRLWSAASGLSDDSVAIDSRLGRIRLQVELALAGAAPPPAKKG